MRRDPTEFRERFKQWKSGNQVYEGGRPIPTPARHSGDMYDYQRAAELGYERNKDGHFSTRDYLTGRYLKNATHPTVMMSVVSDLGEGYYPYYNKKDGLIYSDTWMKLPEYRGGKDTKKIKWSYNDETGLVRKVLPDTVIVGTNRKSEEQKPFFVSSNAGQTTLNDVGTGILGVLSPVLNPVGLFFSKAAETFGKGAYIQAFTEDPTNPHFPSQEEIDRYGPLVGLTVMTITMPSNYVFGLGNPFKGEEFKAENPAALVVGLGIDIAGGKVLSKLNPHASQLKNTTSNVIKNIADRVLPKKGYVDTAGNYVESRTGVGKVPILLFLKDRGFEPKNQRKNIFSSTQQSNARETIYLDPDTKRVVKYAVDGDSYGGASVERLSDAGQYNGQFNLTLQAGNIENTIHQTVAKPVLQTLGFGLLRFMPVGARITGDVGELLSTDAYRYLVKYGLTYPGFKTVYDGVLGGFNNAGTKYLGDINLLKNNPNRLESIYKLLDPNFPGINNGVLPRPWIEKLDFKSKHNFLNRLNLYANSRLYSDNQLINLYATLARRWNLPDKARLPYLIRSINSDNINFSDGGDIMLNGNRFDHTNFTYDRGVVPHSKGSWDNALYTMLINPRTLVPNAKWGSIEPSDMFTVKDPLGGLAVPKHDVTIVTGSTPIKQTASKNGIRWITSKDLTSIEQKLVLEDVRANANNFGKRFSFSKSDRRLENRVNWNAKHDIQRKFGRPKIKDVRLLESVTGLKSYILPIEDLSKFLAVDRDHILSLPVSAAESLINGLPVFANGNKFLLMKLNHYNGIRYPYKNFFYDPVSPAESNYTF